MKILISKLIADLVKCVEDEITNPQNNHLIKSILTSTLKEIKVINKSCLDNKQELMIRLLIGGIIWTLSIGQKGYDKDYWAYNGNAFTTAIEKELDNYGTMLAISNDVLNNLPEHFCGKMFKIKRKILGSNDEVIYDVPFPAFAENALTIDILVHFCQNHAENLNCETMEINPEILKKGEEDNVFVAEFKKRHQAALKKGLFKGFFNKTNIDTTDKNTDLTKEEIIEHGKKTTFFGGKNRTHKILEEMKREEKKNSQPNKK